MTSRPGSFISNGLPPVRSGAVRASSAVAGTKVAPICCVMPPASPSCSEQEKKAVNDGYIGECLVSNSAAANVTPAICRTMAAAPQSCAGKQRGMAPAGVSRRAYPHVARASHLAIPHLPRSMGFSHAPRITKYFLHATNQRQAPASGADRCPGSVTYMLVRRMLSQILVLQCNSPNKVIHKRNVPNIASHLHVGAADVAQDVCLMAASSELQNRAPRLTCTLVRRMLSRILVLPTST